MATAVNAPPPSEPARDYGSAGANQCPQCHGQLQPGETYCGCGYDINSGQRYAGGNDARRFIGGPQPQLRDPHHA
jgi:hypothetical protein